MSETYGFDGAKDRARRVFPWWGALVVCLCAAVLGAEAHASEERRIRELPGPMRPDDLHAVAALLEGSVVRVRVREDLGRHYRPRHVEHEVWATWVYFPAQDPAEGAIASRERARAASPGRGVSEGDGGQATREDPAGEDDEGEVLLMSPWASLARAETIEVRQDGVWIEVTHRHATPFFDLAWLQGDGLRAPDPSRVVQLAERWPGHPVVHTLTPPMEIQSSGPLPPVREGSPLLPGNLHSAGLPPEPDGLEAHYFFSPVAVANGWPLVDDRGRLVGLTSAHSAADEGQVLALPYRVIREWYETRPRLAEHGPTLAPGPEIRRERAPVRTGRDALQAPGARPARR